MHEHKFLVLGLITVFNEDFITDMETERVYQGNSWLLFVFHTLRARLFYDRVDTYSRGVSN